MEGSELTFRLRHVGINVPDSAAAEDAAQRFCRAFGLPYRPGHSSVFAGDGIEVMRSPYLGRCGHIAFGVSNVEDAAALLRTRGFETDPSTAKYDADGTLKAIYLKEEIAGFALHLLRE